MKDGLENIDEVFKQAFDGFEANVDPSVWNNVQNSINSGVGSTPQVEPSSIAGVGKSLALKIVSGVAIVGTVATAIYVAPDLLKDKETTVAENAVIEEDLTESVEGNETTNTIGAVDKNETVTENSVVELEESNSEVKLDNSIEESNSIERNEVEVKNSVETSENQPEQNKSTVAASNAPTTKEKESNKPVAKENNSPKIKESVKLTVTMDVDIAKGKAPLSVQFDAFGNGVQYFWDFSDGSDQVSEESPIHIFEREGTYNVTLTGIDKNGNTKTDFKTIIVEKDVSSSIDKLPNIFTPNGDGENDFYKIRGKNISRIQVKISDGKNIVYFMNSLDDKWDGKDQSGNDLNQGQYYITVIAVGTDGEKHIKRQAVNLRR